jgi:hypothetical protein
MVLRSVVPRLPGGSVHLPHLVSFTERIRDEEINADEVVELAALIRQRLEERTAAHILSSSR